MRRIGPGRQRGLHVRHAFGAALVAALGCVTVNVYFPVAELKNAAEEIVNEVRPESVSEPAPEPRADSTPGGAAGSGEGQKDADAKPLRGAVRRRLERADALGERRGTGVLAAFAVALPSLATAAAADDGGQAKDGKAAAGDKKVELEVSTPVIKKIREALKKRYPRLLPYYEKGAIGEGHDGYLALRDAEALNLKEKREVQTLVLEENADRKNLYTQIARENKIDDARVKDIGLLFSEEWRKKSKVGWWIEPVKGKWEKKKPEEKKKPGEKPGK
jgi:uncharacterized protein YdbL (DUF1318 family)